MSNTTNISMRQLGRASIQLIRILPASCQRVWEYLTQPELLGTWIADGEIEARVGGRVALTQFRDTLPVNTGGRINGTVTRYDAPHALAFTWRHDNEALESQVLFLLEVRGDETVLTITHSRAEPGNNGDLHQYAAGWQVHTEYMLAHMNGTHIATPFTEAFAPLKARYAALRDVADLYHRLLAAWNLRDAEAMAACFSADGLSIGFDGSSMRGSATIAAHLRGIWAHHRTPAYIGLIQEISLLGQDTVALTALAGMLPTGGTAINPALNSVQTLVACESDAGWRIAIWQNTPAAFHGRDADRDALTRDLNAELARTPIVI